MITLPRWARNLSTNNERAPNWIRRASEDAFRDERGLFDPLLHGRPGTIP